MRKIKWFDIFVKIIPINVYMGSAMHLDNFYFYCDGKMKKAEQIQKIKTKNLLVNENIQEIVI